MMKKTAALLAAAAIALTLCACGGKQLLIDPLPSDGPTSAAQPAVDAPQTDAPPPQITSPDSADADETGLVRLIDDGYLKERGMTLDNIFLASSDLLLLFTTRLTGGTVSETSYLYTYSLSEDRFTGQSMPLGVVGQYPRGVLDDGCVCVMTLNSETYEPASLLIVDPRTLSYEEHDLSAIAGLRAVDVAPDRSLVACSTNEALIVTRGFDMTHVAARYDGFVPEGGDELLDYKLPVAIGWTPEGDLLGKLLGWEWIEHCFLLSPDGTRRDVEGFDYLSAEPLSGGRLFIYDDFDLRPQGVLDLNGGVFEPVELPDLPDEEDDAYISALAVTADGQLALAVADPDGAESCRAAFLRGTTVLRSFALRRGEGWPVSFEALCWSPDGKQAAMMTAATVDTPKRVYFTRLP